MRTRGRSCGTRRQEPGCGWTRWRQGGLGDGAGDVRGEVAIAERIDRSWTARFDSLRVFWYRRIVNFDSRSQVETLQAVKAATEQSGKRARETLERAVAAVKVWIAGPWDLRRVVTVLGIVAAAFGVGWVVKNFRWANFDFRFGKAHGGRIRCGGMRGVGSNACVKAAARTSRRRLRRCAWSWSVCATGRHRRGRSRRRFSGGRARWCGRGGAGVLTRS